MQWAVVILLSCLCWNALASPAPHCTPAAMDEDPKVARVCSALNTFLELYAEASAKVEPNAEMQSAIFREYPGLLDMGIKRQDLVHNFLRFGRRR